jgi:hypothetical protein
VSRLDAAALHPRLQPAGAGKHYFAEAAGLRSDVARRLAGELGADGFVPFLLHNTTSGLLAALFAAARAGRTVHVAAPEDQHYPPYLAVLADAPAPGDWQFRTHVSPVTAAVDPLEGGQVRIVDAAQSLGTGLTPSLWQRADVVLAPLHKHLGLVVGLGLALVRENRAELDVVRAVLDVAQSGAQSLELLRAARRAVADADGRVFNVANVTADEKLDRWCRDRGLRLVSRGTGVPFACLTTTDGEPVTARLAPTCWRHFRSHNIARFSFHRPGSIGEPGIDCTAELRAAIDDAVQRP